LTDIVYATILE